jgi:hypothetical protein
MRCCAKGMTVIKNISIANKCDAIHDEIRENDSNVYM